MLRQCKIQYAGKLHEHVNSYFRERARLNHTHTHSRSGSHWRFETSLVPKPGAKMPQTLTCKCLEYRNTWYYVRTVVLCKRPPLIAEIMPQNFKDLCIKYKGTFGRKGDAVVFRAISVWSSCFCIATWPNHTLKSYWSWTYNIDQNVTTFCLAGQNNSWIYFYSNTLKEAPQILSTVT
jgi:hypothetical protein